MYNANIPKYDSTEGSSNSNGTKEGGMSLWDIGQKIIKGKGV